MKRMLSYSDFDSCGLTLLPHHSRGIKFFFWFFLFLSNPPPHPNLRPNCLSVSFSFFSCLIESWMRTFFETQARCNSPRQFFSPFSYFSGRLWRGAKRRPVLRVPSIFSVVESNSALSCAASYFVFSFPKINVFFFLFYTHDTRYV